MSDEPPYAKSAGSEDVSDKSGLEAFVSGFLDRHQITVLCDGRLQRPGDVNVAMAPNDLERCLTHIDTDESWLMDELLSDALYDTIFTESTARRALRKVSRRRQAQRRLQILKPLFEPLTHKEQRKADAAWKNLTRTCFEEHPDISIGILKHFIYQVKQKARKEPVSRHLMPIIFNELQGCGKTYFTRRLLQPLQELCPAPVLLSDLADARSLGVFRYSALLVDDMEHLRAEQVPRLKAMLTNDDMTRRRLGTSSVKQNRQNATLIGTSNNRVESQIPDSTGHRRFATLTFRNGEVKKGGDKNVWPTVRETDFVLLWRSVDAFAPSPIEAVLPELIALQEADSLTGSIRQWLFHLDLNADDVTPFITQQRQPIIRARDLYDLFREKTGSEETDNVIGPIIKQLVQEAGSPLKSVKRDQKGWYYRVNTPLAASASTAAENPPAALAT